MMRTLLAGAATAALGLTGVATARVATDDSVQGCVTALAEVRVANDRNQDALQALDRALLRERRHDVPAAAERLHAERAQAELDAHRAAVGLACHYGK